MTEKTLGCDVSVYDDDGTTPQHIDYNKMKSAGAKFVYIKASQATWMDRDFTTNWSNSKIAGIPRGAYHFLTWEDDPSLQARFFAGLLKNSMGELTPVVDFEWWKVEPSNCVQILWAFLVELEKQLNVIPMIYTATSFWNEYGNTNSAWARYPIWLAAYTTIEPIKIPKPWTDWKFWQFTDRGDGIKYGCESKDLDMNYYNGNESQFNNEFHISGSIIPPDPIDPVEPNIGYQYKNISGNNMNIRQSPSTGGTIIGSLPNKAVVEPLDFTGTDCWAKISEGQYCAVKQGNKQYLQKQ